MNRLINEALEQEPSIMLVAIKPVFIAPVPLHFVLQTPEFVHRMQTENITEINAVALKVPDESIGIQFVF